MYESSGSRWGLELNLPNLDPYPYSISEIMVYGYMTHDA